MKRVVDVGLRAMRRGARAHSREPFPLRMLAAVLVLSGACSRPVSTTGGSPPPTVRAALPPIALRPDSPRTAGATQAVLAARADSAKASAKRDSVASAVTPSEIVREVTKVFGDSAPPPMSASVTPPGAPVWDIDVHSYETRARVAYFVGLFSGRARAPFAKSLQRQTRYGPLIRQRLRDGGLPEDLIYLALIESWYDPHAYSKAAAVGMWQFMAGTARGVGLRVDWWVDERRDPARSTEGAVRMLKALRDEFGSLYLAAAAYDGGDGRVSRGLARYKSDLEGVEGDDRFFALADTKYLRRETRDYVPKLIAAALVGKEPARYGVVVDSLPVWAFDTVRVPGSTPLLAVANAASADLATLQDLNSHLLRGMTPPGESFPVRVPAGAVAGFAERYAAIEEEQRVGVRRVRTKKGESLGSLARTNGITAKQIAWYNPKPKRLKSGNLSAGQTILVPSRATLAAARDVPNPSAEKYPRRSHSARSRTHVVRDGETLSGIAKQFGTSTAKLMKLNGMKKAVVVPGQSLVVRAAPAGGTSAKTRKSAAPQMARVRRPAVPGS